MEDRNSAAYREKFRLYSDLRARTARFALRDDFETVKTVSVIEELLSRAISVLNGEDKTARYGVFPGHTWENYTGRAVRYLEALERGEAPLAGKFTEPGIALVDHCFVEKDGRMHLFYNRGYIGYEWDTKNVTTIGHAVTDDLVRWTVERPCLATDPGELESYGVWSPGVVRKNDTWYMYYTGVNYNACQAICLATSRDLYHWERHPASPVVRPGPWGRWSEDCWSDCRDSMAFVDEDGRAYLYYCSTRYENGEKEPVLGVASSDDMVRWRDEGACPLPGCDFMLESPFVMRHGGSYYLFYTDVGHGTAYARSDDPVRGWERIGMLLPWTVPPQCPANVPSCAEVFEFKGQWYISSCLREPGCEQYLEIFRITWEPDGSVRVGERVGE